MSGVFGSTVDLFFSGTFDGFGGQVDEITFYDRALALAEIQAIHASGSAGKCKPIAVEIDIQPRGVPNRISLKKKGKIPVAILATSTGDGDAVDFDPFDISDPVDPTTLRFGPSGAAIVHPIGHVKDVDGDGDLDLVVHFKRTETGIACGDTAATLAGKTLGGQAFSGTDPIETVGCNWGFAIFY